MTLPLADPEPITVVTRAVTGRDASGNDVETETPITVSGAFAPGGTVEITEGRDTVIAQPHAYLPAGTPVTATSVLVVRGDRYEVQGAPAEWRSPFTGWAPGIDVPLRRATG